MWCLQARHLWTVCQPSNICLPVTCILPVYYVIGGSDCKQARLDHGILLSLTWFTTIYINFNIQTSPVQKNMGLLTPFLVLQKVKTMSTDEREMVSIVRMPAGYI